MYEVFLMEKNDDEFSISVEEKINEYFYVIFPVYSHWYANEKIFL